MIIIPLMVCIVKHFAFSGYFTALKNQFFCIILDVLKILDQEGLMPVTFIEHKGRKILYTDFSSMRNPEDTLALSDISDKLYQEYGDNVRHLMNFENTVISPEFFEKVKKLGKKNVAKCYKDAFVGITKLKAVLLKGYLMFTSGSRTARVFEDIEQAKDWLAEN